MPSLYLEQKTHTHSPNPLTLGPRGANVHANATPLAVTPVENPVLSPKLTGKHSAASATSSPLQCTGMRPSKGAAMRSLLTRLLHPHRMKMLHAAVLASLSLLLQFSSRYSAEALLHHSNRSPTIHEQGFVHLLPVLLLRLPLRRWPVLRGSASREESDLVWKHFCPPQGAHRTWLCFSPLPAPLAYHGRVCLPQRESC